MNCIIVDRFEENKAICEDYKTGNIITLDKNKLSEKAKEGDVLIYSEETKIYHTDENLTKERYNLIRKKFNSIWE